MGSAACYMAYRAEATGNLVTNKVRQISQLYTYGKENGVLHRPVQDGPRRKKMMDAKSIVFGLVVASVLWGIIVLQLLAYLKKREDSWYKECLRLIDHYERAIKHFENTIRNNNKKIITEDEMYRMKNFP